MAKSRSNAKNGHRVMYDDYKTKKGEHMPPLFVPFAV